MSPSTIEFLKHILDEVNFLLDESIDIGFDEFINDDVRTRAFSRSLEIIGEAVKKVAKGFEIEISPC